MTIKELGTNFKFWLSIGALIIASLTALGATIDRPAWKSELNAVSKIAGMNAEDILQIRLDTIQRQLWIYIDRNAAKPHPELKQRIRELEEQKKRLEEQKAKTNG